MPNQNSNLRLERKVARYGDSSHSSYLEVINSRFGIPTIKVRVVVTDEHKHGLMFPKFHAKLWGIQPSSINSHFLDHFQKTEPSFKRMVFQEPESRRSVSVVRGGDGEFTICTFEGTSSGNNDVVVSFPENTMHYPFFRKLFHVVGHDNVIDPDRNALLKELCNQ